MSQVVTPTDDATFYTDLQDLLDITSDAQTIDNSPLFKTSERTIIALIPGSQLPGGRTNTQRDDIVEALLYLSAYNFTQGGGSTATAFKTTQASGDKKSETTRIGPYQVSETYDVGSSSSSGGRISEEDRSDWFKEQYENALSRLGVKTLDDTSGFVAFISPC